jgi:hypothetical protein
MTEQPRPKRSRGMIQLTHLVPRRSWTLPPWLSTPYHESESAMMVTSGRMYGRQDHSLSYVETWDECNCFVLDAQNLSRGLSAFQIFKSPIPGQKVAHSFIASHHTNLSTFRGADPDDTPSWGLPRTARSNRQNKGVDKLPRALLDGLV